MKEFTIRAQFDQEAGVWWGSNDQLPLTTEAPSFDEFMARVLAIAPEIAAENGLVSRGEEVCIHFTADRIATVAA